MRGSFGDFVRKWVSDRKKLPHPNLGKPMYSMRGKNHPNWKGGSTPKLLQIRHSLKYKNWRRAVFERDNYTCLWCGARSSKSNPVYLNADHIKPFALYPETRFDLDNGRTLCVECHKKTDTYLYKLNNKRKWTNGNNVQVTYTVSTAGSSVTAGEPPATTDKNE